MGLLKLIQTGVKNKDSIKGGFDKTKEFLKRLKEVEKTEEAAKRSAKMFTGKPPPPIAGNTRVYHGTRSQIKDPTIGPGGGLRSLKVTPKERIYPLKIPNNIVKEKIFDPSNKTHLKKLTKNPKFKNFVSDELFDNQDYLKDVMGKPIKTSAAWLKEFKKNNFYNNGYSDDGVNIIATSLETSRPLQNILKKIGFDGFTISEGSVKNIGVFLDQTKGGSKILKSIFEKKHGGSIENFLRSLT